MTSSWRLIAPARQQSRSVWRGVAVVSRDELRVEFRHHLRHLLREASYLPDSVCRDYFRRHIISRFRKHASRLRNVPSFGEQLSVESSPTSLAAVAGADSKNVPSQGNFFQKVELLRVQVHETWAFLRRASGASMHDVEEVLNLAYGRSGPHGQSLLAPYLRPDDAQSSAELARAIQASSNDPKDILALRDEPLHLPSAIRALAKAQIARRSEMDRPHVLRTIDPPIPKTNIWGRPTPLKRVRNLKIKGRRELLHRLLPPLPRPQWEYLQRIVMREEQWKQPRLRRNHLGSLNLLSSADNCYTPEQHSSVARIRPLSERFMLRRYDKLFTQCPMIERGTEANAWTVTYGWSTKFQIPPTTASQSGFFNTPVSSTNTDAQQQSPP